MVLSDFMIILCRPSEPGNVGAVCRAMKNMGLSRLRIVLPRKAELPPGLPPQAALDQGLLRARAVHAEDVWENARFFDSLDEAAADCSLLIGTTRRRGRHRKNVTLDPVSLMSWLKERLPSGPIALVFGNERTGLEDAELDLCNIASHVPVSADFPSLNLSHAVQIYAYELFKTFGLPAQRDGAGPDGIKGEWIPLDRSRVDTLTAEITNTLESLGFYKNPGREEQARFLRDLISRAGLTGREGKYFSDILCKSARLQYQNEG
ncbi:MAG: TrmJ/YjtD family RNA methyltransferase [Treponema sp.]|jgi:tRNA/rRNA methyltransferase/tRNA (cytidine32/uridine32-2'-O)-methyltransferase|nr:TrmJ/YjtD family RNA methyltransferase [Treponema sp.]